MRSSRRKIAASDDELTAATSHGGLFVVGTYVPKITTQLTVLLKNTVTAAVEIAVDSLLVEALREKEIRRGL